MKKELWLLGGVPGSGKSTWAQAHCPENGIIISRDAIRFSMLQDNEDYFAYEKEVFNTFVSKIKSALADNTITGPVVADATHMTKKSRAKLLKLIEKDNVSKIIVFWFNPTLKICLERNAQRTGRALVKDSIIHKMYARQEEPSLEESFINEIQIINN